MESNAVLELKAKLKKVKAELKEAKWKDRGYEQDSLRRKNMELNALRRVWCSGGCDGGVMLFVTAEQVAYVQEYASRLSSWYVNHKGREVREKEKWNASNWDEFMEHHHEVWDDSKVAIEFAKKKFKEIECQQ